MQQGMINNAFQNSNNSSNKGLAFTPGVGPNISHREKLEMAKSSIYNYNSH